MTFKRLLSGLASTHANEHTSTKLQKIFNYVHSVPDVGLGLGQGGGRVAPSVPGTVTDFRLGLGTGGDCGSAFWVSLLLLLLQLLCELSLPLLPLLSLWLSLLSDEELCASNSEALGSNTTGWANQHWRTGITRRAGRPSHVSGGA